MLHSINVRISIICIIVLHYNSIDVVMCECARVRVSHCQRTAHVMAEHVSQNIVLGSFERSIHLYFQEVAYIKVLRCHINLTYLFILIYSAPK